jgi:DNA-binding transcriptional regulator YdaS (Cro superfamily)
MNAKLVPHPFYKYKDSGIRDAVFKAGSQSNLAHAIGVSGTSVQQWLTAGYVPKKHILKICELYLISPKKLVDPAYLEFIKSPRE